MMSGSLNELPNDDLDHLTQKLEKEIIAKANNILLDPFAVDDAVKDLKLFNIGSDFVGIMAIKDALSKVNMDGSDDLDNQLLALLNLIQKEKGPIHLENNSIRFYCSFDCDIEKMNNALIDTGKINVSYDKSGKVEKDIITNIVNNQNKSNPLSVIECLQLASVMQKARAEIQREHIDTYKNLPEEMFYLALQDAYDRAMKQTKSSVLDNKKGFVLALKSPRSDTNKEDLKLITNLQPKLEEAISQQIQLILSNTTLIDDAVKKRESFILNTPGSANQKIGIRQLLTIMKKPTAPTFSALSQFSKSEKIKLDDDTTLQIDNNRIRGELKNFKLTCFGSDSNKFSYLDTAILSAVIFEAQSSVLAQFSSKMPEAIQALTIAAEEAKKAVIQEFNVLNAPSLSALESSLREKNEFIAYWKQIMDAYQNHETFFKQANRFNNTVEKKGKFRDKYVAISTLTGQIATVLKMIDQLSIQEIHEKHEALINQLKRISDISKEAQKETLMNKVRSKLNIESSQSDIAKLTDKFLAEAPVHNKIQ